MVTCEEVFVAGGSLIKISRYRTVRGIDKQKPSHAVVVRMTWFYLAPTLCVGTTTGANSTALGWLLDFPRTDASSLAEKVGQGRDEELPKRS